jgi:2'-5' RNA ligase
VERLRLAVALVLPSPLREEVRGLQRAVGGDLRVPPHITLVPPVNVRADRFGDAVDVVLAAGRSNRPLELTLGPATTFWPATPVVYLAVGGEVEGVTRLRDAVFVEPLARRVDWPFIPHVTLAEDVAPDPIVAVLADYRVQVVVDRLHLLTERPGHVWEVIGDAPLGAPRVVGRGGLPVELTVHDRVDPALLGGAPTWGVTARREGEVVGMASGRAVGLGLGGLGVGGGTLWLDDLVVVASCRHQGIGRQLMAAVSGVGVDRGCDDARALCPTGGPVGWFEAMGWQAEGEWTGFVRLVRRF